MHTLTYMHILQHDQSQFYLNEACRDAPLLFCTYICLHSFLHKAQVMSCVWPKYGNVQYVFYSILLFIFSSSDDLGDFHLNRCLLNHLL